MKQLQEALANWIYEAGDCGYCHIGELIHHQVPKVDVWEGHEGIIGFALIGLFGNGFAVYIHPAQHGTDKEREMLQAAYEQIQAPVVITDVWQCDTTRQRLLQAMGFGKYRVWTFLTERSLYTHIPQPQLPYGYTIRHATTDDYEHLAAVEDGAFNSGITAETWPERIVTGYNLEDEWVVVAPDGRFAAYTHIWLDEKNSVGLFEPVGTHPDFQRRGLARALMLHVMHRMKADGLQRAKVNYTVTNTAANYLYTRLGFRTKHRTLGYRIKKATP